MEVRIGKVIKELRGKNRVTQERLAEHIGVTAQSVSKWEAGVNLPDITMLSGIASYFGVTVDYLLYGEPDVTEDEMHILNEVIERKGQGDMDGAIEKLTHGVKLYPRNYSIMLEYVSCIYRMRREESYKDRVESAIFYANRIISESGDSRLVYRARHLLCLLYCETDAEKARKIADNLPDMPVCRNLLLEHILKGEELGNLRDDNLVLFLFYIWSRLQKMALSETLPTTDRLLACTTGVKLWELFFYDGRMGYYHDRPAWDYVCMTEIYAEQGEKEKALASMEKAIEHIKMYKESCQREVFTESIFWYDKRVGKGEEGIWKKEKMDLGFVKQLEELLQGSLGELLSPKEITEAKSRIESCRNFI
ncbi:MAG: helix-turn-helix transcriptional regulator [Lachnospiraceae bacterium]|nr:helix-turn-helix transcriptional regulator [Lachnospiraceae bacterium]